MVVVALTAGAVSTVLSCVNLILILGAEKPKPYAANRKNPFFSVTDVVATLFSPPEFSIEILALTGALVNP